MKILFEVTEKTNKVLPEIIRLTHGVQVSSKLNDRTLAWYGLYNNKERLIRNGHPAVIKEHLAGADKILREKEILDWKLDFNAKVLNMRESDLGDFLFKINGHIPTDKSLLRSILLEKGWPESYLDSSDFTDMRFTSDEWVVFCDRKKRTVYHITHPGHSNYKVVLESHGVTEVLTLTEYVNQTKSVSLIDMFFI